MSLSNFLVLKELKELPPCFVDDIDGCWVDPKRRLGSWIVVLGCFNPSEDLSWVIGCIEFIAWS